MKKTAEEVLQEQEEWRKTAVPAARKSISGGYKPVVQSTVGGVDQSRVVHPVTIFKTRDEAVNFAAKYIIRRIEMENRHAN